MQLRETDLDIPGDAAGSSCNQDALSAARPSPNGEYAQNVNPSPESHSRGLGRRFWIRRVEQICRSRSVILGYHGIARSPLRQDLSLLQVRPSRFRAHLEIMLGAGFEFVTVAQLARLAGGGEPPSGYAAVSFDDGMLNNLTTALPIMSAYGIPGTVYVTVGFMGGISPWVGAKTDNRMMTDEELRNLVAAGWELGAHTMTHPDLSDLGYDECHREIDESKTRLEKMFEVPVETFAYPFGRHSPAAVQAARDSGLLAAVSTGQGSWDPHELKRAMIGALDPLSIVVMKLADRYEPFLRSPPLDLLRRTSKRIRGSAPGEQKRV